VKHLSLMVLGLAICAAPAGAAAPVKKLPAGGLAQIASLASKIEAALETAKWIEQNSRKKGKITVKLPSSKATLEKTLLKLVFVKRGVEATGSVCRVVPFLKVEVPGSAIEGWVETDVQINVEVNLDKVVVSGDTDYKDTVTITLPELRIASAEPTKNSDYRITYGKLTSSKVEGWRGRALREDLFKEAAAKAKKEFKSDLAHYRQVLVSALQKSLRAKFPKLRIHVK